MTYFTYDGSLWALKLCEAKRYVAQVKADQGPGIEDYGVRLGRCIDVTDLTPYDAVEVAAILEQPDEDEDEDEDD